MMKNEFSVKKQSSYNVSQRLHFQELSFLADVTFEKNKCVAFLKKLSEALATDNKESKYSYQCSEEFKKLQIELCRITKTGFSKKQYFRKTLNFSINANSLI